MILKMICMEKWYAWKKDMREKKICVKKNYVHKKWYVWKK